MDKKFVIVVIALLGLMASMFLNQDKEITMFVLGTLAGVVSAEFALSKDVPPTE